MVTNYPHVLSGKNVNGKGNPFSFDDFFKDAGRESAVELRRKKIADMSYRDLYHANVQVIC